MATEDVLDPTVIDNAPVEPVVVEQPKPAPIALPAQEGPTDLWGHVQSFLTPDQTKAPQAPEPSAVDTRSWANRKAKEAGKEFQNTGNALDAAWSRVLRAEGGYTVDTGGETMYGISKNAYPHLDIKSVTPELAKKIYKRDYYDAVGGDVISKINPDLAEHVADMAFNAGPRTALKILYQSVGMQPEGKITEDLINKLSSGDGAVVDYSRNRLAYYADLATSNPEKYGKYLKGWTNRVKNLNKELGYTKGMNEIYQAANAGDSEHLRVASILRPLEGMFNELSEEDRQKLRNANVSTAPIYSSKASKDLSTNPTKAEHDRSDLSDVLKASFKNQYYLNTEAGANALKREANGQAIEENIKSLGDRFTAQMKAEITTQSMQDLGSGGDYFDSAMKVIKKYFPNEKLPNADRNSVNDLLHQNALKIEREYGELESGSFSGGISQAANKLLHVVGGYLPGTLAGQVVDPAGFQNLALGALTAAATGGSSIAVQAGAAAATTGLFEGLLNQPAVQKARGELGLEHGFKEGVINTATAAGLGGVMQGIGAAIGKMVSKGSSQAAADLIEAASKAKAAAKEIADPTDKAFVEMLAEETSSTARMYEYNPHGTGVAAKAQLDADIARVAEDLSTGQPLRAPTSPPINSMPIAKEDAEAITTILGKNALDEWEWFKKGYVSEPITSAEGKPILFPSKEAADSYVASQTEGNFNTYKKSNGTSEDWYVTTSADDARPPVPKVPQDREVPLPKQILEEEKAAIQKTIKAGETADVDKMYVEAMNKLENNPDPKLKAVFASDPDLAADIQSIRTERSMLKELQNCMTGGDVSE